MGVAIFSHQSLYGDLEKLKSPEGLMKQFNLLRS